MAEVGIMKLVSLSQYLANIQDVAKDEQVTDEEQPPTSHP
jgi:hypothetical protein